MTAQFVSRSVLLAAGIALIAGCATPTRSPTASADGALLQKKFERAAKHYDKYQHEGQVVYCKKEKPITSAISAVQCLSEDQLRQEVASFERWRNPVARPVMPGAGQGGIGG
jgi:hypothetical protein